MTLMDVLVDFSGTGRIGPLSCGPWLRLKTFSARGAHTRPIA
ncbi:hypothetical protein [Streptomyces sp. NRRL F-5122]|nr:hypothetical protein [Streptomyces sp. NRRL F-5122]